MFTLAGVFCLTNALFHRAPVPAPIPGVISLPYSLSTKPLLKRGATAVDISMGALFANYIVNITVGTPPQPITLSLDTGSSDTIVLTQQSSYCAKYDPTGTLYCPNVGYCKQYTRLFLAGAVLLTQTDNANKSSSYQFISSNFSSQFGFASQGQGSGASGDVATDTFHLGDATLKNQQFDISYGQSSIAFGILGLSYALGENQAQGNPAKEYNNFPLALAASGTTNLALFSLWKDSPTSHDGQLLFGGVDTSQYTGSLATLDTQLRTGYTTPVAFDVILNGVALSGNSSFPAGSTGSVPVVLDCGTSYTILPNDWVTPIHSEFGVTYFEANDTAYVDCALQKSTATINYTFESLTISVPISVLVSLVAVNPNRCTFGIVPAQDRHALLGDNFLSSAYTVFDLTNNQISLAVRNFAASSTTTTDSVVVVPAGGVKSITTGTATTNPSSSGTASASATTTKKSSAARSVVSGFEVLVMMFSMLLLGSIV